MQALDFLVFISFFSIGLIPFIVFKKKFKILTDVSDSLLIILIFSFSLLCFPLIFLGTNNYSEFFKLYLEFLAFISLAFFLYYLFRHLHDFFKNLNYKNIDNSNNYKFVLVIFIIALITYFFHAAILPLRGYDALFMYFPNAILFSQINSIPPFNPLNFFPVIKEPLNALLYTYSIKLVNNISVDVVILAVIFLWAIVTYKLTLVFFPEKYSLAYLSALMFLFFPLNLWFLDQWFYYQDIFLGFFFTTTVYFNLKSFDKTISKKMTIYYAFISSLSFGLTLISKSSGWELLLIIIAIYLFYSNQQTLQKVFYIGLYVILIILGATHLYIGIIPVLLVILALVLFHSTSNSLYSERIKPNLLTLSIIVIFGVVLGGYWFYYTIKKFGFLAISIIQNYLKFQIYLSSSPTNVIPSTIGYTFESAHRTTFYSLVLVLLISNLLACFWALPKVLSFLKKSKISILVIWVLVYFSIWLVLDSISIRYLTPIISPLIIISLDGFLIIKAKLEFLYRNKILEITDTKEEIIEYFTPYWMAFIVILGLFSLYFPIPLNIILGSNKYAIANAYLNSAYIYYSNWFIVIIILVFLPILIYLLMLKTNFLNFIPKFKIHPFSKRIRSISFAFIFIFLVVFPNFILFSVYGSTNFNLYQTQQTFIYEDRPGVQDILNVLSSENKPTVGIMVYDFPGIPVWLGNPTIDVYTEKDVLSPLFTSNNISLGLRILMYPFPYIASTVGYNLSSSLALPSIDYVIIPNTGNLYYNSFMKDYRDQYYIFPILFNPNYYTQIYNNSDFRLFKRIYEVPTFGGIYDFGLNLTGNDLPLLGPVLGYNNSGTNVSGYAKFYFSHNDFETMDFTVKTTININNTQKVLENQFNLLKQPSDQFNISWPILNNNSFNISSISIEVLALTSTNARFYYHWVYSAPNYIQIIINKNKSSVVESTTGMSLISFSNKI